MLNGWVSLDRAILKHWVSQEPELLACWVHLLLEANFEDRKRMFNGSLVEIKRGQCVFGLNAFSVKTGISQKKLRRYIEILEKEGMVGRQKTNKYSLISITNYDYYQSEGRQEAGKGQAEGKPGASKGQHRNKGNQDNKDNNETSPAPDKPDAKALRKARAIELMELWNQAKAEHDTNWTAIDDPAHTSAKRYTCATARAEYIRQRLKRSGKADDWDSIREWFGKFYTHLGKDDFYSGRPTERNPKGYKATFEQVHAEEYFVKAIERLTQGWMP